MLTSRLFTKAAILLLWLHAVACTQGNSLSGSIDDVFALNFSDISITLQGVDLVVQYTSGADVICGVVIDTSVGHLQAGTTLSGKSFIQAVSLTRATASGGAFAEISEGTLTFSSYSTVAGQSVSGSFDTTLVDGHTLTGVFDGPIRAVAN